MPLPVSEIWRSFVHCDAFLIESKIFLGIGESGWYYTCQYDAALRARGQAERRCLEWVALSRSREVKDA
jgi:hypothetical protein